MATRAPDHAYPPIGTLLREWRAARRMSQLDLSLEAGISTRHLSCVETGKAQASRETVGRLADTLAMPLRERNVLLRAAGYAAMHPERDLAAPALDRVRQAVELIIAHQEPRDCSFRGWLFAQGRGQIDMGVFGAILPWVRR